MDTLVVSLLGGPGIGKSTTAAGVFAMLKTRGVNAELVHEYAKDLTWERAHDKLRYQPYVTAKQMWAIERVRGKVDVIITDTSPLLAFVHGSVRYGATDAFFAWVIDAHKRLNTLDILLGRNAVIDYQPVGRRESVESAKSIDYSIKAVLDTYSLPYSEVAVSHFAGHISYISDLVQDALNA